MFEKENAELEKIGRKLDLLKGKEAGSDAQAADRSGWSLGVRIVTDLLAGVVVGLGIGILLDKMLDTHPVCMIIFLLIGGAAGFLNVYRTAQAYDETDKRTQ